MNGQILAACLSAAARGWRVLPLKPRDKVAWLSDWPNRASTDETTIRSWFERQPECNYGVACGPASGLCVLDVDPRNGGRVPHDLPPTLTISTGGGGWHYYFAWDGRARSRTLSPGVELKAAGRYVVGAGSVHPSGEPYAVHAELPLAPLPESLLREPAYAQKALFGEIERIQHASEGERNNALNRAAFSLGQLVAGGELDREAVESELTAAAVRSGLALTETRSTIKSGLRAGLAKPRRAPDSDNDNRPLRFVVEETVDFADRVLTALAERSRDTFQRGFKLVRVLQSSPAANANGIVRPAGHHAISEHDPDTLTDRLARLAPWFRVSKTGDLRPIYPPTNLVRNLLARGAWPLPPLAGLAECPTMRPDGSLLTEPGFDSATGVMLVSGFACDQVPDEPTAEHVHAAVKTLHEPFHDFPFREDCDRSAALSAVLTAVARPAISGPVPLYAIRAPSPGTGKTLLADVVSLVATGRVAPRLAPTRDDEETRKRVAAIAADGTPVALLDNVDGNLGSPALAMALTATEIRERVLGESRIACVPHRALWLATGNNLGFRGDVARRVVPIDLDAHTESPELRGGFRHSPLEAFVLQRRSALVASTLTVLRAFHLAGRPGHGLPVKGSFEAWDALVRACLRWCSLPDPDQGSERVRAESDPERQALGGFLESVYACKHTGPWSTAEICKIAENNEDLRANLLDLTGSDKPDSRRLGYALRKYKGRIVFGKWIEQSGTTHGAPRWGVRGNRCNE